MIATQKTKDKVDEIHKYYEQNGGLDVNHLRYLYREDVREHKHTGSFKKWFIGWLMNSENVSKAVATAYFDEYV